ncbi:MAG: hypothetical protein WC595_01450 [Candidatus Nanoarchaeia archaeon]
MTMRKILPLALTAILAGTPTAAEAHAPKLDAEGKLVQLTCESFRKHFDAKITYNPTTEKPAVITVDNYQFNERERLVVGSNNEVLVEVTLLPTSQDLSEQTLRYLCNKETCFSLNKGIYRNDQLPRKSLADTENFPQSRALYLLDHEISRLSTPEAQARATLNGLDREVRRYNELIRDLRKR